jgi:hypothetical protein
LAFAYVREVFERHGYDALDDTGFRTLIASTERTLRRALQNS